MHQPIPNQTIRHTTQEAAHSGTNVSDAGLNHTMTNTYSTFTQSVANSQSQEANVSNTAPPTIEQDQSTALSQEHDQDSHGQQGMPGLDYTHVGTLSQQMDRYTIELPALLTGVRCYVDASTAPDLPTQPPRIAGLGILFVNTQVQPVQTIYIKAQVTGIHSVLMAEAAALALAARVNDSLNFDNTTFLSDCQQLVHFLNQQDQTHPPEWRMKPFTQSFTNLSTHRHGKILKINRSLNTTADGLARLALLATSNTYERTCSYLNHSHHCPLEDAMESVNLQHVILLSASCC
jgi:hypothetical protein